MITFTSDKTRGVSHRREKEEAVEFVSGHTHSLSERRQDGEFIINGGLHFESSWTHDMYGFTVPLNSHLLGREDLKLRPKLNISTNRDSLRTSFVGPHPKLPQTRRYVY